MAAGKETAVRVSTYQGLEPIGVLALQVAGLWTYSENLY